MQPSVKGGNLDIVFLASSQRLEDAGAWQGNQQCIHDAGTAIIAPAELLYLVNHFFKDFFLIAQIHIIDWIVQKLDAHVAGTLSNGRIHLLPVHVLRGNTVRDNAHLDGTPIDARVARYFGGVSCCSCSNVLSHHRRADVN